MVDAGGIVVSATFWVGKGIVGVVDFLKFSGSIGAFWGALWDSIGVGFERCSERH